MPTPLLSAGMASGSSKAMGLIRAQYQVVFERMGAFEESLLAKLGKVWLDTLYWEKIRSLKRRSSPERPWRDERGWGEWKGGSTGELSSTALCMSQNRLIRDVVFTVTIARMILFCSVLYRSHSLHVACYLNKKMKYWNLLADLV